MGLLDPVRARLAEVHPVTEAFNDMELNDEIDEELAMESGGVKVDDLMDEDLDEDDDDWDGSFLNDDDAEDQGEIEEE